ncbi:hypothetical protein ZIOFF_016445 [Zingiber officinale]|uniref:Uncharacterized protein n=1 Tax=Zingiber officinale TaxID=94328 RepID=A0A8J5HLB8_ZINOF|nr:hypothetical protein ZIOFF_016445 [Zingiber officinale]
MRRRVRWLRRSRWWTRGPRSREEQRPAGADEESSRNDVHIAAAYGDLEKLQRLVEAERVLRLRAGRGQVLLRPPVGGSQQPHRRRPIHHLVSVRLKANFCCLDQHSGDANATDNTRQTALPLECSARTHPGARIDVSGLFLLMITNKKCRPEPLLKTELNHPALLAGNWSQLCATCKVNLFLLSGQYARSIVPLAILASNSLIIIVLGYLIVMASRLSFKLRTRYSGMLTERNTTNPAGIVRDPSVPSLGGWSSHNTTEHPRAVAFLVMDHFLFFGVAVLLLSKHPSRGLRADELYNVLRSVALDNPKRTYISPFAAANIISCLPDLVEHNSQ